MRIRFLIPRIYHTGAPGAGPHFPKGFVLDEADVGKALKMEDAPSKEWVRAFLNRWTQRKVAVIVGDDVRVSKLDDITWLKPGDSAPKPPAEVEQIEKTDYSKLTKADLEALAEKRGVDISKAKNKAEIVDTLEKAETLGE